MSQLTKHHGNNGLRTFDPFNLLARDFFGIEPFVARSEKSTALPVRFDLVESDEYYDLRGDLPGVKEDDLDITIHDGVLTISASRSAEEAQEGETWHIRERTFGSSTRRMTLPSDADSENVSANLKDGVLSLRIGKRPEKKARKIQLG